MLKSSYCGLFIFIALQQLIFYTQGIEAKDSVPVLIWKDEKPPIQSPAVSSLMIPKALLQEKFLKAFNPDNILLFLQDELSVEDLSSHEEAFKHVNNFMENSHSLYLPTVEAKSSLAHSFSAQQYNVIKIEAGSSVGDINLKGSKNLVLVQLPSTSTNLHRHKALQKTDEIIDNVISKIGKKAKFTVIFTGEKPSVKAVAELEHRRTSRSLQQINPGTSNSTSMHYTQCVLLYLRNDLVIQKGNDSLVLNNNKTVTNIPDCHDYEDSIIIMYKNLGQYEKLRVRFRFTRTERRWTLSDAEVTEMVNNANEKTMLFPIWSMEDVPLNKSFACSQKITFKSNDTTDGKAVYYLYVNGMQVQAFTNGQKAFSAGWDCVGFFTIPIWTGIFTGIIMVIILAVALYMLSEVKTMDRFDDPKGKPIMVTGSNE